MATNLVLQLQVIEPDTDLNSIMIGNSRYSDDVWDLRLFITAKSTKESHKYIRFEYISEKTNIAIIYSSLPNIKQSFHLQANSLEKWDSCFLLGWNINMYYVVYRGVAIG